MNEIWKDIEGYKGIYQISTLGRVKSLARKSASGRKLKERVLKPSFDKKRYKRAHVDLFKNCNKKTHRINRLVAVAFIPNPKNLPCVKHIDYSPLNNVFNNLKWTTQQETVAYGERQSNVKLNNKKVKQIKILLEEKKYTQKEIGKMFNVSNHAISFIKRRKTWKHI